MEKNLTEGSIFKNILIFSLPFLLSYFLQTLYGMADLFIAGQFNGADVISAVAIGSQVMHMLTVMIVGLAMGSTIMIGQAVGAKNSKQASKVVGNTIILFSVVSVLITIILVILVKSIVILISVPVESVNETINYLRICFLGIPFIVAYNVISSIYRGMGDSKSPLYFVAVACGINIVLDILFMGLFDMKASGAALATVISQAVSVFVSLFALFKSKNSIKVTKDDFKVDRNIIGNLLKIGLPVCCQDGFIQISFMIITVIANKRGLEVAAAVGIVEKIITFLFLIPSSMMSTVSTIAAQNIGAKKLQRAEKTLYLGMTLAASIGLFFAMIFQFIANPVVAAFTRDEKVIMLGVQYFKTYVFDCFFAGIHFCFSGYFVARGKSLISFIHNCISIIFFRIPGAYIAAKYWLDSLTPMGLAAPAGSCVSALICIIAFIFLHHSDKKLQKNCN